jgi:hypothetical protein
MDNYYKLNEDKTTSPCSQDEFIAQTTSNAKHVDKTEKDGYNISTVFLGSDYNFQRTGAPILFETMIFDANGDDVFIDRYETYEDAKKGHDYCVENLKEVLKGDDEDIEFTDSSNGTLQFKDGEETINIIETVKRVMFLLENINSNIEHQMKWSD